MKINKIATAIGLTLALSATANAGVLPDSQNKMIGIVPLKLH